MNGVQFLGSGASCAHEGRVRAVGKVLGFFEVVSQYHWMVGLSTAVQSVNKVTGVFAVTFKVKRL